MNKPNPKDDHPVIQDGRQILHLCQMVNLLTHCTPEEDVPTLKTLLSEASLYILDIQSNLNKRGSK